MAIQKYNIVILGGTGFVGKRLCYRLAEEGHKIIVLSRRPERHRDLEVLPTLTLKKANIHDERSLSYYFTNADVVINLVGILNAGDFAGKDFDKMHVDVVRKIISACHIQQVKQLIHFSALGANAKDAPSQYLQTKGKAEELIIRGQTLHLRTTIFRPSIIIGREADFVNKFNMLLKYAPGVMVLPCARSISAPVSIIDVITAVTNSIMNRECLNKRFDLAGPETYTLKNIVQIMAKAMNKKVWVIGLNTFFSLCAAQILQFFPGKPLTPDNVRSSTVPGTSENSFPPELGITPSAVDELLKLSIRDEKSHFSFFDKARKMS
jgi:NADH dehydrogenase